MAKSAEQKKQEAKERGKLGYLCNLQDYLRLSPTSLSTQPFTKEAFKLWVSQIVKNRKRSLELDIHFVGNTNYCSSSGWSTKMFIESILNPAEYNRIDTSIKYQLLTHKRTIPVTLNELDTPTALAMAKELFNDPELQEYME